MVQVRSLPTPWNGVQLVLKICPKARAGDPRLKDEDLFFDKLILHQDEG